jgi:hypothetical protein
MTFRDILASIYGESFHVCDDPSIDSIRSSLARYDCIEFHVLPSQGDFDVMHRELAQQRRWDVLEGADIFLMLREPVDQIVSLYFHMVRKRGYVEAAYNANRLPFPESLEEFIACPWHFNNQLAFLIGNYRFTTKSELGQKDLAEAKDVLLRLRAHVGLMERYSESLHIFEKVTDQRVDGRTVKIRNQNPDRPRLEYLAADIKQKIADQSRLDIELYEFAQALFKQDLAQYGLPQFAARPAGQ